MQVTFQVPYVASGYHTGQCRLKHFYHCRKFYCTLLPRQKTDELNIDLLQF